MLKNSEFLREHQKQWSAEWFARWARWGRYELESMNPHLKRLIGESCEYLFYACIDREGSSTLAEHFDQMLIIYLSEVCFQSFWYACLFHHLVRVGLVWYSCSLSNLCPLPGSWVIFCTTCLVAAIGVTLVLQNSEPMM